MEFLTLQDVPRYHHRSAMTLRECSPLRYPARQQEAAERMKPHPQTSAQLPSFKELLDSTASSPDSQSAHIKSSPASSDHHWQTSSARASRQSSAERPVFHDPFRGVPPLSLPSRSSTQHARPGPSTENYTTQIDVRPSLLQARPPTNYDSRRTSLRADYEPRIPSEPRGQSLPSLFNSSRVGPAETVVPNTIHNVYHASNSYSAGPITEVARYSEPVYASVAYPGEHHPHRPPYVSEHTRASMRHDSSVFPAHEHHWPPTAYAYGQGYGYVPEHHNGMDNYPGNRRRRGNLPKEATALLKKWFQDHAESPYPSDEEKNQLAMATGLTSAQISNWFINARRRNPGKEARELARAMNSNRNSCQQPAQGASSTQDQDLSVHTSTSPPQQQSRHAPQQQHHEQRYSLPQITSSKYPYDPRDHQHDRDHDMGNA